jgi:glycosyltransferase involved in cell wall biosynthesis
MPEPALHFSVTFAISAPRLGVKRALLLSLLALLPDFDVLFHIHRSMSHSIIMLGLMWMPILAAFYYFRRRYLSLAFLCFLAVLSHPVIDCFQAYTPILYPAYDRSIWVRVGGWLLISPEGFTPEASVNVRDTPTVFNPIESFDAPIFTSDGFLISLLLVAVPLFLSIRGIRKQIGGAGGAKPSELVPKSISEGVNQAPSVQDPVSIETRCGVGGSPYLVRSFTETEKDKSSTSCRKIIACIPAYNEEFTIAGVVLKAMRHVDRVIVCDDGSTDLTGEIARRLGAEVIRHEKNMGKGAALKDMFLRVLDLNPDFVVVLDADGQHDADEIPRIIEPLERDDADIVVGSRFVEGANTDAPLYRRFGLRLINTLGRRVIKASVRDTQSGFRAFTVKSLKVLKDAESSGFGIESEQLSLALKMGLRIVEVPVTIKYRGLRKTSKKTPFSHAIEIMATMLKLFVVEKPLLYLGVPGVVLIAIAMASGAHLLLLFNMTRYFSIPIALITIGALFTGMTLFVTALILYAIARLARK